MSKNTQLFEKRYNQLNTEQREAVDMVEGPVMVIAGPGTGKTTVLTLRIANILRVTDADPGSILALTFTEAAAYEMRERLVALIGGAGYRVPIHTFHGFCQRIIERHPEAFPRIVGSRPMTDIDQLQILRDIVLNEDLELLCPIGDPLHYVYAIKEAISTLKKENVDVEMLYAKVEQQEETFESIEDLYYESGSHAGKMKGKYRKQRDAIAKNKELSRVYTGYQQALEECRLYDYDDMIMQVIRVLEENEDLKLILQEQYQYILADEHQDANEGQNRLLELLSDFHDRPNLFVVGDDKQAIYRFQGASLENFYYFQQRFSTAKLITLEENYRSTQPILDAAGSLIVHNARTQPEEAARLQAMRDDGGNSIPHIIIVPCTTTRVELLVLRDRIAELLNDGVLLSEIAVLVRTNAETAPIVQMLERAEVPFMLATRQNIFGHPLARQVIALLRAVQEVDNEEAIARAAFSEVLKLDPLDVADVLHTARERRIALNKAAEGTSLESFFADLKRWRRQAEHEPLMVIAERIVEEGGVIAHVLSSVEPATGLGVLHALFDMMREHSAGREAYQLSDFLEYLTIREEHGVIIKKRLGIRGRDGVQVTTAHSAKGREFDYVFVVNAVDGNWGGRRSRISFPMLPVQEQGTGGEKEDSDDDERRLFYVALTRARRGVVVSYPRVADDGRERMPSRFLGEIRDDRKEEQIPEAEEELLESWQIDTTATTTPRDRLATHVRELFDEQGLSVTALNNYLHCPWQYFFMNLLQLPRAQQPYMIYGTAVHRALEVLFGRVAKGEDPGAGFLVARFRHALRERWMDVRTLEEWLARGEGALTGYYRQYSNAWVEAVITEHSISNAVLGDIPLRGKLDKLELLNATNDVNIVDYKTGKPRSKNYIMGKTKNADGSIYRQLVFYKLLLDITDGPYRFVSGTVDYVEPNDSGNFRRHTFQVPDDDVAILKETIEETAEAIRDFSFWGERCDDADCEFCTLRQMLER